MTSNTQEKLEQILEYSIGLVESGKNVRYKKHNDIGFYNKNKFVFEINNESPRLFFNRDDFYLNGARVAYQALENISNDIIVDLVPKSSEELDKIIYAYQYTSNEDDFVSKLNEGREESNKMGYDFFRSLLLLKILEKHPDKANEVQENSIFFPQRLFVSHKLAKDKKKQQEIELASSILEIFSSDMVDRITKYNNLVNKSVRGDNWENFRESKYASMFKRNDECTDEEISRLYDTISVKRDIIKTLYDSLSVFGKLNNCQKI